MSSSFELVKFSQFNGFRSALDGILGIVNLTNHNGTEGNFVIWVNQYAVAPREPGGTRHFDYAKALGAVGWHVEIIAGDLNLATRKYSKRRGPFDGRAITADEDGVRFCYLWLSNYQKNDWRRMASMASFGAAVFMNIVPRKLGKRTVIVGSSPHLFAAFGAFMAAKIRRRPFVFEVRDLWPESYIEIAGDSASQKSVRVMRWLADSLYKWSSSIIVLAESNKDAIARRGADSGKIIYIPNGADPKMFTASARTDNRRNSVKVFIYAGAHGPANGLEILLGACQELEQRHEERIKVLLVGDGPDKPKLVARAKQLSIRNLEFSDPVAKSEIPALFSMSDCGLMLLADTELFTYGVSPNKLFDYLAAGLPVVTNVPGFVADVVTKGSAGICCAPGDPEALADAMIDMVNLLSVAKCPFTGGPDYVASHFDRDLFVERIDTCFKNLLG